MLIWSPEVFPIASTQIHAQEFLDWMTFNQLETVDSMTPLGMLWSDVTDEFAGERLVEFAGRHCYRAWLKGRERREYIHNIIEMEHGSVLEHASVSFAIQGVSRSLTHELVRHRVGVGISQESQRYVDAADLQFVVPPLLAHVSGGAFKQHPLVAAFEQKCAADVADYKAFQAALKDAVDAEPTPNIKHDTMLKKRCNESARALLPNAAETRLVWTANYRLLRHFFFLRGGMGADLEIRRLAVALLEIMQAQAPSVFSDLAIDETLDHLYGVPVIRKA